MGTTQMQQTQGRRMRARYHGRCTACGGGISPGDEILYAGRGSTAHVRCPVAVPAEVLATRWHGEPECRAATVVVAGSACRRCGGAIEAGEGIVSVSVRLRGRSSDDRWHYHAACWEAALPQSPAAAPTAAPARHVGASGAWCVRCGGPSASGSPYCGECE